MVIGDRDLAQKITDDRDRDLAHKKNDRPNLCKGKKECNRNKRKSLKVNSL